LRICSNGWVTNDTVYTGTDIHGDIPDTTEPNYVIAPLWTDLTPVPPDSGLPYGKIFYHPDTFFYHGYYIAYCNVIEWKNFYVYGDYSGIPVTFQMLFWEWADYGVLMHMNYLSVPPSATEDVTVGVDVWSDELYLEEYSPIAYINRGYPPACIPADSMALLFYWEMGKVTEKIPAKLKIGKPYPNPFNSAMEIQIEVPVKQNVCAEIFSIDGKKITTMVDDNLKSGKHKLIWRADENVSSGIYFIKVMTNDYEYIRKAVLVR